MNAYTISSLAEDAGVSVHVVRDHVVRGLLHPARRTEGGYGIFDERSLARLRFVRTAFEAGIGLDELTHLCRAIDAHDDAQVRDCVQRLLGRVAAKQTTLSEVTAKLAELADGSDRE
ncbi:mercuric resistance transcriptional repressor protein MerD [Stenotrophomonas maltophilia]|uniref:mercuric resistance transcriptional repressor MerD n=1 Tax=Lysobacteraceae TaxID=32033 RepID=UPI0019D47B15|nr:mercuric resistance transcriptional repressor MerD [Stenotrophomonas maltophilia]MBN7830505.1 mercuric resistance transcriptional repressor protein MerD [Stenotrophomonas maltophilia]MBN7833538.1 mercuric resistance transcriptional repressor protein MerD [Stenotrophomonas maltophilia]MBN7859608.1 mercuric resistance transcriptional repressor protein MerD [Stenotrophomonas maltophilia]MBN7916378.1 mercuric resistance transcriptional repressor protein MerD [Stenotrophomonas maltophilia]MBO284